MNNNKTVFLCRTITPLFMSGANQKEPELRAPSLKGVLRFWWRAVQTEKNIDLLREKETEIFGGTGDKQVKSSFSIRLSYGNPRIKAYRPLPHHTGRDDCEYCIRSNNYRPCRLSKGFTQPAFDWQEFTVILSYNRMPDSFSPQKLEALFLLTTAIGGLGKRCRRGFGSFQVISVNDSSLTEDIRLDRILDYLDVLAPRRYEIRDKKLVLTSKLEGNYPFIQEIVIGQAYNNVDELLRTISRASSNHSSDYTGFTGNRGRMASPVYISVIRDNAGYRPVITSLCAAFQRRPEGMDTRKAFKGEILYAEPVLI